MHEEQDIFTITLIVEGDNSKLLLSTSETPAKEDQEASGVIYREDLPAQFEAIVSKIPLFRTAMLEDGSEESVTYTIEEFKDFYDGLDLLELIESGDELLHKDNAVEDENHMKEVFSEELKDADPFDIYRKDSYFTECFDPREAL